MAYPTDNEVIPQANAANKLSNMHTSISHVAGTNKLIDKLHAVAAKLGIGTSTPGDTQVLATDNSGNSSWIKLTNDYLATGAAIALSKLAPGSSGILKSNGTTISAGNKVLDADIDDGIISLSKLVAGSSGLVKSNGSAISAGNKLANTDIDDATIALARLVAGASGVLKSNGTVISAGNTISNSDIAAGADIAVSKLAGGTARQVLAMNAAGDTPTWTTIPPGGTAGATLFVAANDATAAEKAIADYVCDNSSDQTEINNAVAALPATGGKIQLSSGTFTIGPGGGISLNKQYTILEGCGYNTVIKFQDTMNNSVAAVTLASSFTALRNVRINGNKAGNVGKAGHLMMNVGSVAFPIVENVYIHDSAVHGILTDSDTYGAVFNNVIVSGCLNLGISVNGCTSNKYPNHYNNVTCISNAAGGFSISGFDAVLTNCTAIANATNYAFGANPGNQLIGCKSYLSGNYGYFFSTSTRNQLVGCYSYDDNHGYFLAVGSTYNQLIGCYAYSSTSYSYRISGSNNHSNSINGCFSISDNHGIYLDGASNYNNLIGNFIDSPVGYGIYINGGSHHVVKDNFVLNASVGSSAYAGIVIASDYNSIIGNTVRKGAGSSPQALNISSGTGNIVSGNDLFLGGTVELVDSGTQTFFPVKSQVADSTAIYNTISDTAFSVTHAYSPNKLGFVGRVIKIKAWGFYSSTGSPNITLKVKFGSTTLLNFGPITAPWVSSSRRWSIDATITVRAIGASGSVQCEGEARIPTANDNETHSRPVANSTTTIDTTAAQTLTISATHSISNYANTITMTQFVAEVLN